MYRIVTGVTSDVGVPSTYLVSFLPEASFGLQVLSSPASVCLCVCLCVCVYQSPASPYNNLSPIQARITKFGPEV